MVGLLLTNTGLLGMLSLSNNLNYYKKISDNIFIFKLKAVNGLIGLMICTSLIRLIPPGGRSATAIIIC